MPGPLRDDERRDPMPGLFALPGYLFKQLGSRGRKIAAGLGVALAALTLIFVVVLVPGIRDSKEERDIAEQTRAEQRKAETLKRLRAEIVPRQGSAPELAVAADDATPDEDVRRRRRALILELEQSILADARKRVDSGELRIPVRTVNCQRFPRSASDPPPEDVLTEPVGRYECLAVTSRIIPSKEQRESASGEIGYPFRALAEFEDGTFTWCKISGRAGEGGLRGKPAVPVPEACGGAL